MTYEQYWYGDVWMVGTFHKAEELRQERADADAWLAGIYFKAAIESSIGNAFRKKGSQPVEYPSEPMLMKNKRVEEPEMTEDQEVAFAKLYMMQLMEAGKNWGNTKQEG